MLLLTPFSSKCSLICGFQVSIVASYIKERTKNAQFIVISLRNNMVGPLLLSLLYTLSGMVSWLLTFGLFPQFELASRLVGVYKVNHMTKSVTVENKDYVTRA